VLEPGGLILGGRRLHDPLGAVELNDTDFHAPM
jgi:hypothetical protein